MQGGKLAGAEQVGWEAEGQWMCSARGEKERSCASSCTRRQRVVQQANQKWGWTRALVCYLSTTKRFCSLEVSQRRLSPRQCSRPQPADETVV